MKKHRFLITMLIVLSINFCTSIRAKAATTSLKAGIVSTDGSRLNIRSKASTSSSIIGHLNDNTYISLVSKNGSWWLVEYGDNKFGYVNSNYISVVNNSYNQIVKTGGGRLNVRNKPSITSTIIDSLPNGKNVVVISMSSGFARILYNGIKTGYSHASYLSTISNSSSSTYKYPKIILNVVSYKQFDSRWADLQIGSSGKTMKQVGCTTTALAMTESYRTNTTITPANMRNRLSYTSDGSLYWPSQYKNYYSSDYLSKLYSLLSQGKPVIISFKKANGNLHFVVVTGYKTNSNQLSASNFIINDPGSSYRTTLSEVISVYPTYNKINYY